jgi:hypothetical protein
MTKPLIEITERIFDAGSFHASLNASLMEEKYKSIA